MDIIMDKLKAPQRGLHRNPQRNIMNLSFMVVTTTSFTPLRYFSDDSGETPCFLKNFFLCWHKRINGAAVLMIFVQSVDTARMWGNRKRWIDARLIKIKLKSSILRFFIVWYFLWFYTNVMCVLYLEHNFKTTNCTSLAIKVVVK